ncbi:BON domain-containing protein [Cupriavidus taiwanensis]|uniref:BON domain-containing protein n=1 Tax=Cupriavidus taiwanensis TaxID=164546 RepID=UPI000E14D899|nr:BON domain-containing protein [Cupriavidus taiwanensis]SOZ28534.1 conserved exported hypothetical protein [Cupriavidus taiwanensis]SPA33321.1 conserved exported hypothetical protein [Cupriavidus taiwanensis]
MRFSRTTARTLRMACAASALAAAAGSALALDKSGLIFVAADDAPVAPVNSAPGMPGRPDPATSAATSAANSAVTGADQARQSLEDSAITTKIKTRLLGTKELKATGIHVTTQQGAVEVSGTVPTQQHALALKTIRSVEGVTSVNDKLKVSTR